MKICSDLVTPGRMKICLGSVRTKQNEDLFRLSHARRRHDEYVAPAEEVNEEEEEQNQPDFDWEVVVDEAALQGESGSDDQFFYAQVDVEEPAIEAPAVLVFPASPRDSTNVQQQQESTPRPPLAAFLMPSSVHFKLILRGLGKIRFRLTWRKFKPRMPDFCPSPTSPILT
ncbi:hypothetical protein Dimus_030227 [Dionaea muscipula]